MSMLSDIGAMKYLLDEGLISRLNEHTVNSPMNVHKKIISPGKLRLPGIMTDTIYGTITINLVRRMDHSLLA